MCLTIPKKILSVNKNSIIGQSFRGEKEKIAASIVKIKVGDWALTQNGIVVNTITSRQAREINNLLK